jgi:signal transduction histidine kinase
LSSYRFRSPTSYKLDVNSSLQIPSPILEASDPADGADPSDRFPTVDPQGPLSLEGRVAIAALDPQGDPRSRSQALRRSLQALFTPLTIVVGFSDLLRDERVDDEERRRHAELVYSAGRELEQRLRRALADLEAADAPAPKQLTLDLI